jgi:hypothetical protein
MINVLGRRSALVLDDEDRSPGQDGPLMLFLKKRGKAQGCLRQAAELATGRDVAGRRSPPQTQQNGERL